MGFMIFCLNSAYGFLGFLDFTMKMGGLDSTMNMSFVTFLVFRGFHDEWLGFIIIVGFTMEMSFMIYINFTIYMGFIVTLQSRESTYDNCRLSLTGSYFFGTQLRIRKPSGTLVCLKNRTPTQPIKQTKFNKFS